MLQLHFYTEITRHGDEGTVMLLSLYTGKATVAAVLTRLLEHFTISSFPKLLAVHQLPRSSSLGEL